MKDHFFRTLGVEKHESSKSPDGLAYAREVTMCNKKKLIRKGEKKSQNEPKKKRKKGRTNC